MKKMEINNVDDMLYIIGQNADNFSFQRAWFDYHFNTINGTYQKLMYEKQNYQNECDNCSTSTDRKWCSLECFCSDSGV